MTASGISAQNDVSKTGSQNSGREVPTTSVGAPQPPIGNVTQATTYTEGFDSATFPPAGWSVQNRSTVIGTNTACWNQFTTTPWAPQAGTGHAGANFNCTAGANTISGWLITPVILFHNGDQVSFWTRKGDPDQFPDGLELRLSNNGASTNVGTTSTSVGDFTNTLLTINPTLVTGVYPITYTQFTVTLAGLPAPVNGRLAFRYFVTNGGPSGANSDILSIDTFSYTTLVTAATASISGRVLAGGKGVANARVEITGTGGQTRSVMTNPFGNFTMPEVNSGATYVVNVSAKRYSFASQVVSVTDNVSDLTFTAQ